MRRYAGPRTSKGRHMDVLANVRRTLRRPLTLLEDYALARDPEIRASLAEADANLAAGKTGSLDDLLVELGFEDLRRSS